MISPKPMNTEPPTQQWQRQYARAHAIIPPLLAAVLLVYALIR